MKRRIALFLFVLFANDVVVDAFDASCMDEGPAACHTCVCGTHYVASHPELPKAPLITSWIPASEPDLSPVSASRVLYRPPKSA